MRLHRFYTKEKIGDNSEIEIFEERIVHQVRNVFRLGAGDKVVLFDGSGFDFDSEIISTSKSNLELKITNSKKVFVPEKRLTLFMSVIKKENFELVCEKACELGISKIVPVVTERTLMKNLNRERIEKILIEASEQCGRGDVPELGEITNLELVITNSKEQLFVADIGGNLIRNSEFVVHNCSLLIGPEGGWSEEEREMFKVKKINTISLGETVLRAETAAIVGVAFLR